MNQFLLSHVRTFWIAPLMLIILAGCAEDRRSNQKTNVILISIDTCRADYIEAYHPGRAKTPAINELANDGVLFENAITPVPMTLPAHCSMLTGLHPIQHGVRDNFNFYLNDQAVTLAELFHENGYATAAAVGAILLSRRTGLSQGFDVYDDEFTPDDYMAASAAVERTADRVVHSATSWLEQHTSSETDKPFFLFVHFYDPHMMYQPPPPFDQEYAEMPYAGEIAFVDQNIGALVQYLKDNDLYQDSIIVLVGDHGEGLNEHNEFTHGLFLYETTVRVPFLVKPPKGWSSQTGSRSRQSASIEDVVPTLIELCSLGPVTTNGRSLVPWLIDDSEVEPRDFVLETQYPLTFNWSPLYALRTDEWKYIHAPIPELYQYRVDTQEQNTKISTHDTVLQNMKIQLEEQLIELTLSGSHASQAQLTTDRMEMLMSLGYAAGGTSDDSDSAGHMLPDPKMKIEVYNLIDRGLAALSVGSVEKAIYLFQEALLKDPNNPTPYANLGLAYSNVQEWDRAIHFTVKALEIAPNSYLINLQLSRIYVNKNDLDKAKTLLEAFLQNFPTSAEAHFQLGRAYMKGQDFDQAIEYFQKAQKLMPDMPGIAEAIQMAKQEEEF